MATRSRIALKTKSGYRSIYCHWDGYPEGVGAVLNKYYKTPLKIKKLLALGDISSLGSSPQKGSTIAYRRDRGESNVSARTSKTLEDLRVTADRSGGVEYLYIFENGKWRYEKVQWH